MIIDTHAHIYSPYFEDIDQIMANAANAGVGKILLPNVSVDSISSVRETTLRYPGICYPMIGLHPCDVKDDYLQQLEVLHNTLEQYKFFGIGEIGMDLYWDLQYKASQIDAFKIQLEWALEHDLPVAIHSRNANDESIALIEAFGKRLRGVFHCFSGTLSQAKAMIQLGFYLGIGGVVTYKNGGIDKVLEHIDLDHIVLETDSPYLPPVPNRGKRNEPAYLLWIINKIAEIKGTTPDKVIDITTINSKKLFRID